MLTIWQKILSCIVTALLISNSARDNLGRTHIVLGHRVLSSIQNPEMKRIWFV